MIINARSVQFKIDSLGIKAFWSFGGFTPPPPKKRPFRGGGPGDPEM